MSTMKKMFYLILLLPWVAIAEDYSPASVIVVDKKNSSVQLLKMRGPQYEVLKTYHATLGLIPGDKEKEGDKKTPEGIYLFEEYRRAPQLDKKFGSMALTMNFPNVYDRYTGRNGSGIWLHSTDDPLRLTKAFDSLGCVVIKDEEINELNKLINYRTTPIAVYEDFSKNIPLSTPDRIKSLHHLVLDWAKSWSDKNLDTYISFYHPAFADAGKNLKQWKAYKSQLNRQYQQIRVNISNLSIVTHPKYDVAIFRQVYESRLKGGAIARKTDGVKILYLVKDQGAPKILSEDFRNVR